MVSRPSLSHGLGRHAAAGMRLAWRGKRRDAEQGQMAMMILGFGLVILMLITVVIGASQVFVYQRAIHSAADGAALAGTNGIDTSAIYTGGVGDEVILDPVAVRGAVRAYVNQLRNSEQGVRDFDCPEGEVSVDGSVVTVVCRGVVQVPLVGSVIPNGQISVDAVASSEAFPE